MKRTLSRMLLACTPAVALAAAAPLSGVLAMQRDVAGGELFTEVEFGARAYVDRPGGTELAIFEQYRHDPSSVLLENLRVWWKRDSHVVEVRARQVGERDQSLGLRITGLGVYAFTLERERTPHLLSTTALMLGEQPQRGEFTLPVPRPYPLEHNTGAWLERTGVRWTSDRLVLTLTPRPTVPFRAQYTRTTKSGDRPMGMVFGSAGGNLREVLEPVENTTHDVRLSQGLATPRYQLSAAYNFSFFDNQLDAVVSDNPLVDQPNVDGTYRGRTALPPSNRAHTVSASAGVSLPLRSRITGSASYGWRSQDHTLLPHTINPHIFAEPVPASLRGDVRTLRVNLSARARPLAPVRVSARYRLFDLDDRTPDLVLGSRVRSDQAILTGPFERRRYPYTRETAGADVRWTPFRPISLSAEYAWERWKRDPQARNVGETREHRPRVTVDLKPSGRIWLRGSYLWSERRADEYREGQDLPLLRRFDQSDRDRERASISVQTFPLDALDISLSYDRGESSYPGSTYGRQDDDDEAWAAYVGWSLGERIIAHASYVHESFQVSQRSRFLGELPMEFDNATFDWISVTDETVRTVGFGGTVSILPRKLDLTFAWDRSQGSSQVKTHNPEEPVSPNVGNRHSAAAEDFPEVSHSINPAHVRLRYRLSDTWMASIRYTYESFTNEDFRTDGLAPATGMDVFLGNELLGYTAQYVAVTVSYNPWIRGVRRPPL